MTLDKYSRRKYRRDLYRWDKYTRDDTYKDRIVRVDRRLNDGTFQLFATVEYVDTPRKTRIPKRIEFYHPERRTIVRQDDGTYVLLGKTYVKQITDVLLNQEDFKALWCEVDSTGNIGPQQECSLKTKTKGEQLSSALVLLFLGPLGWFYLFNQKSFKSIGKSIESIKASACGAYDQT